ncbi:hypothetical protein F-M6_0230 [Faustovirus]|nr:hypothetical protein F-M6_0230 [Faustovirus]
MFGFGRTLTNEPVKSGIPTIYEDIWREVKLGETDVINFFTHNNGYYNALTEIKLLDIHINVDEVYNINTSNNQLLFNIVYNRNDISDKAGEITIPPGRYDIYRIFKKIKRSIRQVDNQLRGTQIELRQGVVHISTPEFGKVAYVEFDWERSSISGVLGFTTNMRTLTTEHLATLKAMIKEPEEILINISHMYNHRNNESIRDFEPVFRLKIIDKHNHSFRTNVEAITPTCRTSNVWKQDRDILIRVSPGTNNYKPGAKVLLYFTCKYAHIPMGTSSKNGVVIDPR